MLWKTPEQAEQAKEVYTFDFLQARYPNHIKRTVPNKYRLVEHPSLVLTPSNGKWDWKPRVWRG